MDNFDWENIQARAQAFVADWLTNPRNVIWAAKYAAHEFELYKIGDRRSLVTRVVKTFRGSNPPPLPAVSSYPQSVRQRLDAYRHLEKPEPRIANIQPSWGPGQKAQEKEDEFLTDPSHGLSLGSRTKTFSQSYKKNPQLVQTQVEKHARKEEKAAQDAGLELSSFLQHRVKSSRMPYKRKYGGHRKFKRGRVGRRKYQPVSTRLRAYTRNYLASDVELKTHDTDCDVATVANTGVGFDLCAIAQGTTDVARLGRKITVKGVYIAATLSGITQTSTLANYCGRISLVLDTQANGATVTTPNIFNNTIGVWADIAGKPSLNPVNLRQKARFKLLWTKDVVFYVTGGAGEGAADSTFHYPGYCIKKFVKLDLPVVYDSTTGAITEIRSNNLLLMMHGDETNKMKANCHCRLFFVG